jgi:hypothetical protein
VTSAGDKGPEVPSPYFFVPSCRNLLQKLNFVGLLFCFLWDGCSFVYYEVRKRDDKHVVYYKR